MLSIQTSSMSAKCNILPCRINYTGPTNATEKHWIALDGEDGNTLNHPPPPDNIHVLILHVQEQRQHHFEGENWLGSLFRSQKAIRVICSSSQHVYSRHVSNTNSGHVLEATDEELPHREQSISQNGDTGEEKINIFKGLTTFEEITIWEHDATPDESTDGVIRTIEEWIGFANKVSSLIVLSAQVGKEMLIPQVKDPWIFNG